MTWIQSVKQVITVLCGLYVILFYQCTFCLCACAYVCISFHLNDQLVSTYELRWIKIWCWIFNFSSIAPSFLPCNAIYGFDLIDLLLLYFSSFFVGLSHCSYSTHHICIKIICPLCDEFSVCDQQIMIFFCHFNISVHFYKSCTMFLVFELFHH